MIVLVGIILVSRVECRTFIKDLPQSAGYPKFHNFIISRDSMDDTNELYVANTDSRSNNGVKNVVDIHSQEERIFSDEWKTGRRSGTDKDRELIQTYVLVRTVRQRNKRYVSYLTLCHFKICNIGKKRTTRYVDGIRTTGRYDI